MIAFDSFSGSLKTGDLALGNLNLRRFGPQEVERRSHGDDYFQGRIISGVIDDLRMRWFRQD